MNGMNTRTQLAAIYHNQNITAEKKRLRLVERTNARVSRRFDATKTRTHRTLILIL